MKRLWIFLVAMLFSCSVAYGATTTTDVEPGERLVITGTCADTANEEVKTGTLYIEAILWITPANIADDLELLDGDGDVVYQCKVTVASQSIAFYPKTIVRGGLYVDQLDSGSVVIFYRSIPNGRKDLYR